MIVVHHLNESRSQRILWLLEELRLDYEVRCYQRDPKTRAAPASLQAVHPLGKSPVITDDGHVVAESGAIIEYLLRHYGKGRLSPHAESKRFDDHLFWMHYAEGSAMAALIVRINVSRVGEGAAAVLPRLDAEVGTHLRFLDAALDGQAYLLGRELSAADIQLSFFGELAAARVGLDGHANVTAWVRRFQALETYKAALKRGGDYPFIL